MNRAAAAVAKWGAPPRVSPPRSAPALDPVDPAEFAAFRNNCSFTQNKHARAALKHTHHAENSVKCANDLCRSCPEIIPHCCEFQQRRFVKKTNNAESLKVTGEFLTAAAIWICYWITISLNTIGKKKTLSDVKEFNIDHPVRSKNELQS